MPSQPSTSTRSRSGRASRSLSQSVSSNANKPETNASESVNELVRYIVCLTGKKTVFRSADLTKITGRANLKQNVPQVAKLLKEVYGYTLTDRSGYFVVTSDFNIPDQVEDDASIEKKNNKSALFIILCHIFMVQNQRVVNELSIVEFFRKLDVPFRVNSLNEMVKNGYLELEESAYKWGMRAENDVCKKEVLKFVTEVYGGTNMKQHWPDHYISAHACQCKTCIVKK